VPGIDAFKSWMAGPGPAVTNHDEDMVPVNRELRADGLVC